MGGQAYRDFTAFRGLNDLFRDVARFGKDNPLTALNPNLDGVNPDGGYWREFQYHFPTKCEKSPLITLVLLLSGRRFFDDSLRKGPHFPLLPGRTIGWAGYFRCLVPLLR